jgi:hypothetical protein
MIIAALFIMGTILTETTLYIIKQNRDDKVRAWKAKQNKKIPKNKSNINITIPFNLQY